VTPTEPHPTAASADADPSATGDFDAEGYGPEERRAFRAVHLLGILVFLLMGVAWGWAFVNSGKIKPHSWLTDRRFPDAAEPICKATRDKMDALPFSHAAPSPSARADVVDQGTALLTDMQAQLRTVIPKGGQRESYIQEWVEDWTTYLDDRSAYARGLRSGQRAEFMETVKYGTQLSKSLNGFADINKMPHCKTPGDV
jgi:hypothetical protein